MKEIVEFTVVFVLELGRLFTFPSVVTAAKTVEEYGAQATSVTEVFSSKVNTGDLWETCIITCISYNSVKTKL